MSIIADVTHFSPDASYVDGGLTTIFLIISLLVSLVLLDSKYWNKYVSDTFDMSQYSLLPVFATIVLSKVVYIMR